MGHVAITRILLEAGVDVNLQVGCVGPLHNVSRFGREEVVRMLLEWGADVTIQDDGDGTALLGAAKGGCPFAWLWRSRFCMAKIVFDVLLWLTVILLRNSQPRWCFVDVYKDGNHSGTAFSSQIGICCSRNLIGRLLWMICSLESWIRLLMCSAASFGKL
jgi:hypothetical protein